MSGAPVISIRGLGKSYGEHVVLDEINLDIQEHEFIAFVGKSGEGKSTLLRLVAGLEHPDVGSITQNGLRIDGINEQARMMFQEDRLLPWMSVTDNVTFASTKSSDQDAARELLDLVGLTEYAEVYPTKLSGGQKQRLALARALFSHPALLLLDEPLGALDALTRRNMQDLILRVCQEKRVTTILVTHDINEAVRMCDRIALLQDHTLARIFDNPHKSGAMVEDKEARALIAEDILGLILD